MKIYAPIAIGILVTLTSFVSLQATSAEDTHIMSVWVSCDGTIVTRTDVGLLQVTHGAINQIGCRGAKVTTNTGTMMTRSGSVKNPSRTTLENTGTTTSVVSS